MSAGTPDRSGPVAVLVGAPGAGKTTVGTALASRLGVGFTDTDHRVEEVTGRSVSEIFLTDGEPVFRVLEREAVRRALLDVDAVVSLGGGAVLDEDTRQDLRGRPVVWLRVSAAESAARVGMSGARPLLMGSTRSQLIRLLQARTPLYAEVAWRTVDTDGRAVDDIVSEVAEALAGRSAT